MAPRARARAGTDDHGLGGAQASCRRMNRVKQTGAAGRGPTGGRRRPAPRARCPRPGGSPGSWPSRWCSWPAPRPNPELAPAPRRCPARRARTAGAKAPARLWAHQAAPTDSQGVMGKGSKAPWRPGGTAARADSASQLVQGCSQATRARRAGLSRTQGAARPRGSHGLDSDSGPWAGEPLWPGVPVAPKIDGLVAGHECLVPHPAGQWHKPPGYESYGRTSCCFWAEGCLNA